MIIAKLLRIKLYLLLSFSAIFISAFNILGSYFYLKGPLYEDTVVVIENGLSIHKIARKLSEENIIKYPGLFEAIATVYSFKSYLKSGEYEFTSGITPYQVLVKLTHGRSVIHKLRIPEGLMISEIIDRLRNAERLRGKITENIPEGYLMPSTYHYSYGDTRWRIINMMRKSMSSAIDEAMAALKPDSPLKTRKDVLILASIIEKEAGNDKERPKVAAVFINRLKRGMKLQADPTVAYGVTMGEYKLDRPLSRKDLRTYTDYNTYKIYGLPPGPISCPGRNSIMAVANPAKIKALYFVVDGKGGHVFSNTLKQHNIHVQKYRKRQRNRKK